MPLARLWCGCMPLVYNPLIHSRTESIIGNQSLITLAGNSPLKVEVHPFIFLRKILYESLAAFMWVGKWELRRFVWVSHILFNYYEHNKRGKVRRPNYLKCSKPSNMRHIQYRFPSRQINVKSSSWEITFSRIVFSDLLIFLPPEATFFV